MAWIAISLRKQSLQRDISETTKRILQLSRSIRSVHRNLSYEQTIFNNQKSSELRAAKEAYNKAKGKRPTRSDSGDSYNDDYAKWQEDYTTAQENYQEEKLYIEEYYDDIMEDLEEEAQEQEDFYNDQKTQEETQLEALQAELQALTDQVKTDIQNEAIKF